MLFFIDFHCFPIEEGTNGSAFFAENALSFINRKLQKTRPIPLSTARWDTKNRLRAVQVLVMT